MLGCDIVVASADATFPACRSRASAPRAFDGVDRASRAPHSPCPGNGHATPPAGASAAGEALRYGLINEVVAPDELSTKRVGRWVADILACAPLSVRAIKQMVRAGERVTARGGADAASSPALIEALQSSDQDEGVSAFKEKRLLANGASASRCRTFVMADVIASTCIDVKDGACQVGVFVSRTNGRLNDPYLDAAFS